MYRKRRKIQSYRGTSRGRFGGSFKFIVIAVVALAIISALITGVVLGKNAERAGIKSFGRHNLTDFGGVKKPVPNYDELGKLQAHFALPEGDDRHSFKIAVGKADGGNAIAFWVNDGEGRLCFAADILSKTTTSMTAASTVTAEEISDIISDEGKLAVALFTVSSFAEEDNALRLIKSAEETALLSEFSGAGVDEIVLFDLPDDSDLARSVTAYLSGIEAECERANICVALSQTALNGSGATRIINATEGYADAYAADLRGLFANELSEAIERYAYFISNYNMRLIVSDGEQAVKNDTVALLEAYGIESYMFVK